MPKTLVLFHCRTGPTASLADAVTEGARSVRFSEVDVRCMGQSSGSHRVLAGSGELAAYDAIIVGAPPEGAELVSELTAVLDQAGPMPNKVGAAFTAPGAEADALLWAVLRDMGRQRMILVPAMDATDAAAAADLGRRVAEVTAWITHARSHHHSH